MKHDENCPEKFRELYTTKLSCGKDLLELTTYNDISMWWMIHPMFMNIMCTDMYYPVNRTQSILSVYQSLGIIVQPIIDVAMATIENVLLLKRGRKDANIKHIAFITGNLEWKYDGKTDKKLDLFFDSTINELRNRGLGIISSYPVETSPIEGMKTFIDKIKNWDVPHIPSEVYFDIATYKDYISAVKYFKKAWKILCEDNAFREICGHYGNDGYSRIMNNLKFFFIFLFPYLVRESCLFRRMLIAEKPSAVVMLNEYGWIERSYLAVSKTEGVPVIAIQHGIIHSLHSGYIHNENEISGSALSPYCPIPDFFAVSGEYYKRLIMNIGCYPENTVIVTGQPRYDIFYELSNRYDKEEFLRKYNIKSDHKLIVWTTQSHGFSDEENYLNYQCIFNIVKEIDKVTIIVKQHPGEPEIYTKQITDYINKYNYNNIIIVPKDYDTNELIYISDLLITKTSTTAIEAAVLDRPVIVLELSGDVDAMGFVKEGIAFGVNECENLKTAIQTVFNDPAILSDNQKKYISEHLFRIDGRSSSRFADLIDKATS